MLKKIKTLEDAREYVRTHYDAISQAWDDMLYDIDQFGEEYQVEDFIEEADMQIIKGHISAADFL